MKYIIDRKRFDLLIWPIISCQTINFYIILAFRWRFLIILVIAIEKPISHCRIFFGCESYQQIFYIINTETANQHKIEHFGVQDILSSAIA